MSAGDDKERYEKAISDFEGAVLPELAELQILGKVLQNPMLQKLFRRALAELCAGTGTILKMDLVSSEGLAQARFLQGRTQGAIDFAEHVGAIVYEALQEVEEKQS